MNMNITCVRGETPSWVVACTRDDQPVDLTGAMLAFAAKRDYTDAVPLITRSSAPSDGIVISNPGGGLCVLTLEVADTTQFNEVQVRLLWDLKVTEVDGNTTVVAGGYLTILPNVAA